MSNNSQAEKIIEALTFLTSELRNGKEIEIQNILKNIIGVQNNESNNSEEEKQEKVKVNKKRVPKNKSCLALDDEQYITILKTINKGFVGINPKTGKPVRHAPNPRIAKALLLESNLGIRIGDVLNLKLADIVKDGDRYRLEIFEEKTGKIRKFTVHNEIYTSLLEYTYDNGILRNERIFPISVRAVQKHLKAACDHLGYSRISTHSFRKRFATKAYLDSEYNIELVRELLQHSSIQITQEYVGIKSKQAEKTLNNIVEIPNLDD